MTLCIPEIPAEQLDQLVQAMNTTGCAVVPDFLDSAEMESLRAFVTAAIRRAGGDYAGFIGPAAVAGSALDLIAQAAPFRALMRGVYERGTGQPGPEQSFYQVLRCLYGSGAAKHAYYFHYDSYQRHQTLTYTAQLRVAMEVTRPGCAVRLFQAWQQASTMAS